MELEDYFNKYKNRILNIGIIVLGLIVANNIYKAQNSQIMSLKESKDKELKKNGILNEISSQNKRLKSYINFLNKKDISLLIDNIADIAKSCNTKIASIRPEPAQPFALYVRYAFYLAVNTSDYLTLGRFINKLENSNNVFMVENLNVSPRFEGSQEASHAGLSVNLRVSTYLYKE